MKKGRTDPAIASTKIRRFDGKTITSGMDEVSVEAPLQIRIAVAGNCREIPVAITMRTPGDDVELSIGYLFGEGIITHARDIIGLEVEGPNRVKIQLRVGIDVDPRNLERQSFQSSSCGVCGKRWVSAVNLRRQHPLTIGQPELDAAVISTLPEVLRDRQGGFARTGGIHASALFDVHGHLLSVHEDVGRHNALDKLIGSELRAERVPMRNNLLLVSGRVSFELVQKAAIAGIPVLAAVGAPSSLAVRLARHCGMTLLGFLREGRFNIYADFGRIHAGGKACIEATRENR